MLYPAGWFSKKYGLLLTGWLEGPTLCVLHGFQWRVMFRVTWRFVAFWEFLLASVHHRKRVFPALVGVGGSKDGFMKCINNDEVSGIYEHLEIDSRRKGRFARGGDGEEKQRRVFLLLPPLAEPVDVETVSLVLVVA